MTLVPAASAYSKFEHEQLTFYAFEIARELVCVGDQPPPACAGFYQLPATELGVVTRAVDYFSNPGRLAPELADCLAGDKARQGSEKRRASETSEDREARKKLGGCRDKVVEACRSAAGPDECLAFALEHTREKVVKRRNNRFYRALAVHRNDEHFRKGAQQAYNTMHERAIRFARQGHHELALVAEAVAIHFLQDGFSPGHLAAPRDQYGDSHAGALHDRANKQGLTVWVGQEICDTAGKLRDPLDALLGAEGGKKMRRAFQRVTRKRTDPDSQDGPVRATPGPKQTPTAQQAPTAKQTPTAKQAPKAKRITDAKRIPLKRIQRDLKDFEVKFCKARTGADADTTGNAGEKEVPLEYNAFGDKRLLAGRTRPARRKECAAEYQSRHRASLLTLVVMSIGDVLLHDQQKPPPLQLCFHPPILDRDADEKSSAHLRFQAPGLAVGQRPLDSSWPRDRTCWQGDQEGLIFGYSTDPPPPCAASPASSTGEAGPVAPQMPSVATSVSSTEQTASSPPQEPSTDRYDLRAGAHQINSLQAAVSYWGAERRRFELGHDVVATEKYFERDQYGMLQAVAGRKFVATAGYVLHYEEVPELEVLGGGLLFTSGTQFKDFDVYGAIEPGVGHYRYPGGTTTRFRWSARAGLGLSILALEGIVERGFELSPTGELEKEWRPSVNFRFRVAPSWLALPFQKLKGKGKPAAP